MELVGKIYQKINSSSGYILGSDGKLYLYLEFFERIWSVVGGSLFCGDTHNNGNQTKHREMARIPATNKEQTISTGCKKAAKSSYDKACG